MAIEKSSAPHAHPSTEEQDDAVEAHYACLERPCGLHGRLGVRGLRRRARQGEGSFLPVPSLRG
jgi:hypothetical protein